MRGNPLCGSNRISPGIACGLGAAADSFIVLDAFSPAGGVRFMFECLKAHQSEV